MTTQSLTQYQPFLFKRVSLISVNFLRYEGNLIAIQENTNSLMLSNVKCFGTEDREVAKPIPAAQEIYEYIIFKDVQIKTLNLSNDQFVYGMNPMMYHNMPYPNFMGGAQSFFPGFPMYYYNWPYGQMPPMNNYMQQNMNPENRSFGDFNNPSFDMNRDLNLNLMQNPNMTETFDVKKDMNFDGGLGAQKMFKVDGNQNKTNEMNNQTQMKLNEVQMKMGDLNLKQNDVQSKPQNDTHNKLNDVQSSMKHTEIQNQPQHKNVTQEKKEFKTENKSQNDVKTQSDIKTQIDAKNSQNIVKTDTPTPKSNEVKTKEKTSEEYKSSNENKSNEHKSSIENKPYNENKSYNDNKSYDKNKNLEDANYKKNYNNRYNNRYNNNNDNRQQYDNRYNNNGNQYNRYNGNYNNNYNKGGPRRYNNNNNDRPNFNNEVVDIFESTKKFEKEKELAQIEAEFQKQREEGNLPEDLDPEKAYNPTNSIYDNLSCETTDKKNNKRINKMERQKQLKEQERIDAETFGLSFNNPGYSNNFNANRNFPNKPYRNTNYSKGPNPSHRQHNTRQQYTPKGQQKKVFRVKNTNEQD